MSFALKLKQRLNEVKESIEHDLLAEEQVVVARINICEECPRLFRPTQQCKECGCFVKAKARIKNASCPLSKW